MDLSMRPGPVPPAGTHQFPPIARILLPSRDAPSNHFVCSNSLSPLPLPSSQWLYGLLDACICRNYWVPFQHVHQNILHDGLIINMYKFSFTNIPPPDLLSVLPSAFQDMPDFLIMAIRFIFKMVYHHL